MAMKKSTGPKDPNSFKDLNPKDMVMQAMPMAQPESRITSRPYIRSGKYTGEYLQKKMRAMGKARSF